MQKLIYAIIIIMLASLNPKPENRIENKSSYLQEIKAELEKKWPENRTINLVFHGHSVPAGYFKTPTVNTLDSYPFLLLIKLKEQYPYAVINVINTAIGGEHAVNGGKRFDAEVLTHHPDILFIDYSLNDRGIGLENAFQAWNEMIKKALDHQLKVILLTPSPDQRIDIFEPNNELEQHRDQVVRLAEAHGVGLVDSYQLFKDRIIAGDSLTHFMSQVNHPNKNGHQLIADEIFTYFE
ncbi:MAG: SGNH/GDSL hydrolase family protein [Lunatimonas sp.]|uniref:SGNH/GDSL hydrolase family protein n=1 Tax=Lunatimonas sp. TaxID=2060141 RepID=UPI00263B3539|nr:SGNH/GDSL hydrolase family protein [Lunatimonas sp.]MCC5935687.1 SGNH/GDSL hydrolase family protein [Lunatimonas sp.]